MLRRAVPHRSSAAGGVTILLAVRLVNTPRHDKLHAMDKITLKVRACRLAAGLTQEQLAERADISQGMVAHIEAGRRTPSLEVLHRIARALGVQAGELLDGGR